MRSRNAPRRIVARAVPLGYAWRSDAPRRRSHQEDRGIQPFYVVPIAWIIGFGLATAWAAARLDRVRPVWFAFGAVLGPIALLLLWLAPPAWCRVCLVPTRGWLRACWWCGEPLRGRAPATAGSIDAAVARSDHRGPDEPERTPRAIPAPRQAPPAVPGASPFAPTASAPATATTTATTTSALERESPPADRRVTRPEPQDDVRRRSPATPTAPPKSAATDRPPSEARLLASAVYFSGTSRLQPGGRYGISVDDARLLVTGPFDPAAVALDRPLAGIEASVGNGRLLLSVPDGNVGIVLVFTSIVGMSVDALAETLTAAATGSERA